MAEQEEGQAAEGEDGTGGQRGVRCMWQESGGHDETEKGGPD